MDWRFGAGAIRSRSFKEYNARPVQILRLIFAGRNLFTVSRRDESVQPGVEARRESRTPGPMAGNTDPERVAAANRGNSCAYRGGFLC